MSELIVNKLIQGILLMNNLPLNIISKTMCLDLSLNELYILSKELENIGLFSNVREQEENVFANLTKKGEDIAYGYISDLISLNQ